MFGVLLWGFLVMGELTTSYAPGKHGMLVTEALAVVFVMATSAAAWRAALLRSLDASPASSSIGIQARGALLALVPLVGWLLVMFCATAAGKSASKNIDEPSRLSCSSRALPRRWGDGAWQGWADRRPPGGNAPSRACCGREPRS